LTKMKLLYEVEPNITSFNAAMFACHRSRQWSHVIELYDLLMERSLSGKARPQVTTFNMALEAYCHIGSHCIDNAMKVFGILDKNNAKVSAKAIDLLLHLLDKENKQEAGIKVMQRALSQGYFAQVWATQKSMAMKEAGNINNALTPAMIENAIHQSTIGDGGGKDKQAPPVVALVSLLKNQKESYQNQLKIDFHGCRAAVARTLLRLLVYELQQLDAKKEEESEEKRRRRRSNKYYDQDNNDENDQKYTVDHDVLIVTGVGKHSKSGGVLKNVVRSFFKNETSVPITEVEGYSNTSSSWTDGGDQGDRGTNEGRVILKRHHLQGEFIRSRGVKAL
jgi:hypothetical protein